jgi:uncharacterized protein (DUF427 family)
MAERVAAYPRPPALIPRKQHVRVDALGRVLCDTRRSLRVLETFHPPVFYLCPEDGDLGLLEPVAGGSFCEWKGLASYFDLVAPGGDGSERRLRRPLWSYPSPTPAFAPLAGWLACYLALMDGCWVDGERVIPQPGGFYGGWITAAVEGPYNGDPLHPELR